jgi:hypothetical protein
LIVYSKNWFSRKTPIFSKKITENDYYNIDPSALNLTRKAAIVCTLLSQDTVLEDFLSGLIVSLFFEKQNKNSLANYSTE